jgi:hypothetical protein
MPREGYLRGKGWDGGGKRCFVDLIEVEMLPEITQKKMEFPTI